MSPSESSPTARRAPGRAGQRLAHGCARALAAILVLGVCSNSVGCGEAPAPEAPGEPDVEALAGVRRIRLGRPAPSSSLFDLELDDFVVSMERTDCLDYLRPFRTRTFGSRPEMTNLVGWMEGHAPETRVALSAYSMGEVPDHAQRLVRELMKHMAADLLQRGLAHVREVGSDEYLPAIECDVWASDGRAGRTFRAPDRMTVLEVIDSMV